VISWNDNYAFVSKAISVVLKKVWGIRNGTALVADVSEFAAEKHRADGIHARHYLNPGTQPLSYQWHTYMYQ
jgi:hypothetical protein